MGAEQKERILRFYRGSEGEETAIRLLDLIESLMKTQKFRLSAFLDPYGQEIAETICASYDGIQFDFSSVHCSVIGILRVRQAGMRSPALVSRGMDSLHISYTVMCSVPSWGLG